VVVGVKLARLVVMRRKRNRSCRRKCYQKQKHCQQKRQQTVAVTSVCALVGVLFVEEIAEKVFEPFSHRFSLLQNTRLSIKGFCSVVVFSKLVFIISQNKPEFNSNKHKFTRDLIQPIFIYFNVY